MCTEDPYERERRERRERREYREREREQEREREREKADGRSVEKEDVPERIRATKDSEKEQEAIKVT